MFAETWRDGSYLAIWSWVALLLPIVALVFGIYEGFTHTPILTLSTPTFNPTAPQRISGLPVAFSELLPLMAIAVAVGTLSANAGLLLVLGYAAGDLYYTINNPQPFYPWENPLNPSPNIFANVIVPHLISYLLFAQLAVLPIITAKLLAAIVKGTDTATIVLRNGIAVAIQGAIIYAWTLGAPLIIRSFWGWGWLPNATPPTIGLVYIQTMGDVLVKVALAAAILRSIVMVVGAHNPKVAGRALRYARALKGSSSLMLRLPSPLTAILIAGLTTLLLGGIIATTTEALLLFGALAVILIAQSTLLPRLKPWSSWSKVMAQIPLFLRLIAVALLSYYLTQWILNTQAAQQHAIQFPAQTPGDSFEFLLISVCVSLFVATILIPRIKAQRSAVPPQPPAPMSTSSRF